MTSFTFTGFHSKGNRFEDMLADVRDLCDDFTIPMVTIARKMEDDVRARILGGISPSLAAATIKTEGAHTPLINTGTMFGSLNHGTTPTSAVVYLWSGAARLHDTYGRKAGFGRTGGTYKRRGKTLTRAARKETDKARHGRTAADYEAAGIGTRSWSAMPQRPFMYLTDEREDEAYDTILDFLFAKFND